MKTCSLFIESNEKLIIMKVEFELKIRKFEIKSHAQVLVVQLTIVKNVW
jgi:hypothetical protein